MTNRSLLLMLLAAGQFLCLAAVVVLLGVFALLPACGDTAPRRHAEVEEQRTSVKAAVKALKMGDKFLKTVGLSAT